jgi:hypothetical protein
LQGSRQGSWAYSLASAVREQPLRTSIRAVEDVDVAIVESLCPGASMIVEIAKLRDVHFMKSILNFHGVVRIWLVNWPWLG